jgi:hypothetical protein
LDAAGGRGPAAGGALRGCRGVLAGRSARATVFSGAAAAGALPPRCDRLIIRHSPPSEEDGPWLLPEDERRPPEYGAHGCHACRPMIARPCGAAAPGANAAECDDDIEDAAEWPAPSGGLPPPGVLPVVTAAPDVADVSGDESRSPAPQKRHVADGLHCDQCMLAVAAAATTSTKMTPTATRPALLEWITVVYLGGSELQRDCQMQG